MGSRFTVVALVLGMLSGSAVAGTAQTVEDMRKAAVEQSKSRSSQSQAARQSTVGDNLAKQGIVQDRYVSCVMKAANQKAVADCAADRDYLIKQLGPVHPKSPASTVPPKALPPSKK